KTLEARPSLLGRKLNMPGRLAARRSEQAQCKPRAKACNIPTGSIESDPAITNGFLDRNVPEPNLRERAKSGFDEKVNFETRIAVAHVDSAALEHQPVAAPVDGNAGKPKFDHVPAVARRGLGDDVTADVPDQKVGIQIRGIDEIVAQPALRPKAHFLDNRKQ